MSKKIIKSIIIIALFTIFICYNFSYCKFDDVDIDGKIDNNIVETVKKPFDSIINIISLVGSGISIIALIALGIRYMTGTLEERAEYKKTMLPYVIGACFVFGASIIPSIIYQIFG